MKKLDRLPSLVIAILIVGTVTGYAYDQGPAPQLPPVSGVFAGQTCAMSGCHTGNPPNAPGGTLTVTGLPSNYVSGQTYDVQVSIARGNALLYGFQMTSVDEVKQQAGTFQRVDNRAAIEFTGGLMVIQHTLSGVQLSHGVFNFKWTAPDITTGPVRINVAANAANGNSTTSGDFIYTKELIVAPAQPDPNLTTKTFVIPDRGGVVYLSDGNNDLSAGYARVIPASGNVAPGGVAIFGLRQNGILISEACGPNSRLIQSGRMYAEVVGAINTGVAIANPGGSPATVAFTLTDASGTTVRSGSTTILAGDQIAAFMDQVPFSAGPGFRGAMTFSSSTPISVIALRGLTNERSEFVLTTLPVVDVTSAPSTGFVLTQYADGGGWTTEVLLVNPGDTAITGRVSFRNSQGNASNVSINGQLVSTTPYAVAPRSSLKLKTSGSGSTASSGSVVISSTSGPAAIPLVVFSFRSGGVTVTEAGVPAFTASLSRLYVEANSAPGQVGAIQSGIAFANTSSSTASVSLELFGLDGT